MYEKNIVILRTTIGSFHDLQKVREPWFCLPPLPDLPVVLVSALNLQLEGGGVGERNLSQTARQTHRGGPTDVRHPRIVSVSRVTSPPLSPCAA